MSVLTRLKALSAKAGRGIVVAAVFTAYAIGIAGGYALSIAGLAGMTAVTTAAPAQAWYRRRYYYRRRHYRRRYYRRRYYVRRRHYHRHYRRRWRR